MLLLDLTIPGGMGGKDTIDKIREINQEIPVIVLSGYAEDPIVQNPTQYGFTASISKPFIKNDLIQIISKNI